MRTAVSRPAPAGRITSSVKFGRLLAHFFLGDKQALSLAGAARLCGLKASEARLLLDLLSDEGLLRRGKSARGPEFRADVRSARYKYCLRAYRLLGGGN